MRKNNIEEIMKLDLSVRFDTYIVDEEDNEEAVKAFELKRKYESINPGIVKDLAELLEESEDAISNSYSVNEIRDVNIDVLREKIDEYGGEFCFDLGIFSHNKKIGYISLTRVYVNSTMGVMDFIDAESPQSMDIAHYICNTDFKKVSGTYVAIYDCFVLDKEYQGIGIEREVIDMLDSFLIEYEFEISKTYIKAISISEEDYDRNVKSEKMLNILTENQYELVDSDNYIMSSDFWDFDLDDEYL